VTDTTGPEVAVIAVWGDILGNPSPANASRRSHWGTVMGTGLGGRAATPSASYHGQNSLRTGNYQGICRGRVMGAFYSEFYPYYSETAVG
jgi:hypothetical protein